MSKDVLTVPEDSQGQSTMHIVQSLSQFLRVVRYRKQIVIGALVVSFLLGGLYFATTTRFYQSTASLLVLSSGSYVGRPDMQAENDDHGLLQTYQRLITSPIVLEDTINRLEDEDRVDFRGQPRDEWVDVLRDNLSSAVIRKTNIINVSYRSKSPRAAVSVVNAVVASYLEFMEKTHRGASAQIINLLTKEKVELEQKIAYAEQQVTELKHQLGQFSQTEGPSGKVLHPAVERAVKLNQSWIEAQHNRVELQASLAALEAAIRDGEDLQHHLADIQGVVGRDLVYAELGLSPRTADTQARLERELLKDKAELTSLLKTYGPRYPKCVEVSDRIAMTEVHMATYQQRIDQQLSQIRNNQLGPLLGRLLRTNLSQSWERERAHKVAFEEAHAAAISLGDGLEYLKNMERELAWLHDLRDALLKNITNLDTREDLGSIRTAVVEEPRQSDKPVWPRPAMFALVCALLGLGAGLAIVYVADILDDHFRSPEELQSRLDTTVLAMVRRLAPLEGQGADALQMHRSPDSVESEAFRTLRTTLAFAGKETRRIVASSAEPGDGKTTVLANLAAASAHSGKKTLLIDADLRRPGMTNLFGMRGDAGLSEVLRGDAPVRDVALAHLRPSGVEGLDILPSGLRPSNPAELLAGQRMSDLLAWAETVYDQILIDSPPALAASDAAIIGRLVDGVILVVQPDKNQRRVVVRAVESFTSLEITLLGVVINRVDEEGGRGYYEYTAGYGYGYSGGYAADDDEQVADAAGQPPAELDESTATDTADHPPTDDPDATIVPRRAA